MTSPATAHSVSHVASAGATWPQGLSHRATMSIGQLLEDLKRDFPQVTVSKVRYLENEGLITPERTDSGYRKFSPADAARLRFVLAAQRDRFMPLRVIRERLEALDAGQEGNDVGLEAVPVAPPVPTGGHVTVADLAASCGLAEKDVEHMVAANVLHPDRSGRLAPSDALTVRLVARLAPLGIELRHLRPVINAVGQELELIEQATAVLRHRRADDAREAADQRANDLAGTLAALHSALLRGGLANRG